MIQFNTFSVVDLIAAVLLIGVSMAHLYRYLRVSKQSEDGVLAVVLFFLLSYCLLSFAADNVVPSGTPSSAIPDAAEHTLLLYRLAYASVTFILISLGHFGLRYCQSKHLPGWQAGWIYVGGLLFCLLFWSDSFLRAAAPPRGFTSTWLCAVPWQPDSGLGISAFLALWLAVNFYVQSLFLNRFRTKIKGTSDNLGFKIVWAGVSVWGLGGIIGMVSAAFGYAGVDTTPPLAAASMLLLAIGLGEQYTQHERERVHVTRRFKSYVDPALVKRIIEQPGRMRFEGEIREMSVVFTDLEGYTATSERLREGAAALLNEYLSRMTRLIHEHQGYRHRFAGDGMMFFYGAPEPDRDHALHAVETVVQMQQMIVDLNESIAARRRHLCDAVVLAMRAGVSTGRMTVGDAGSDDASDYTVVGDAVNLGSRLESANKVFGTHILMTSRTVELLPADLFVIRPIANLRVAGLSRAVVVYEPLAYAEKATKSQKGMAHLTRGIFESFRDGNFAGCLTAVERMEEELGTGTLSGFYRQLCSEYMGKPPPPEFAGEIVLTVK